MTFGNLMETIIFQAADVVEVFDSNGNEYNYDEVAVDVPVIAYRYDGGYLDIQI